MSARKSFNDGNVELLPTPSAMVTSSLQAKMEEYRSVLYTFEKWTVKRAVKTCVANEIQPI